MKECAECFAVDRHETWCVKVREAIGARNALVWTRRNRRW